MDGDSFITFAILIPFSNKIDLKVYDEIHFTLKLFDRVHDIIFLKWIKQYNLETFPLPQLMVLYLLI